METPISPLGDEGRLSLLLPKLSIGSTVKTWRCSNQDVLVFGTWHMVFYDKNNKKDITKISWRANLMEHDKHNPDANHGAGIFTHKTGP